jgi:DNA polymerase-1
MKRLKADKLVIALSCPSRRYWRHDILPTYKAHRSSGKPPMILGQVKRMLADEYESFVRPGLEADDVMGILATHPTLIKGEKVIVSADKDMKGVPGNLYNHQKDEYYVVSKADAKYFHMTQALTGDSTDGYAGCPGCGPVSAKKLLDAAGDAPWSAVVSAYAKAGLTEQDALVQAQVARICQASDYDFKQKKVKLWTPQ